MLRENLPESETLPRDELKARALTRVVLMTAAGIAVVSGLMAMNLATRPLEYLTASTNFVGLGVYLLLLYLQHRGRSFGARITMLLAANLHLALLLVFYGWNTGIYMYFFLMIAVPFAIFSRRQKALITPMASLAVVMLIGVYVYYGVLEMQPFVARDARGIMVNMFTNLGGVSVASVLLMRHMRNVHFQAEDGLEQEHRRSEELLLNVLPASIAERLKQGEKPIADDFSEVSILFADIVGFTELAGRMQARDLVDLLNEIFSDFDRLADEHGLEKIKTIGDCYMIVAGLPQPRGDGTHGFRDAGETRGKPHAARSSAANSRGHSLRAGSRRRHRPSQIHVRSMGRRGEHSESHGISRRAGRNHGQRAHL